MARFALLLALGSAAYAAAGGVTPIQKVLEMMNDLKAKGIAEKEAEHVKYSAFAQWCGDTERTKKDEIAAGNAKIAELKAEIELNEAAIRDLTARIEELDEDVGRWERDTKAATEVRERENADFKATQQDFTETLDALSQAIAVLKKQAHNREQAELVQAFIQVRRQRLVPDSTKSALDAFLQNTQPDPAQENERLFREAPEANAYEFQSGGVVDMLVKLQNEFDTKRTDLEKEEMAAQHNFEMIAQQLADNIENANHEIAKKTKLRAETQQAKAENEGNLAQTTKDRDEDSKYLDDMLALCEQKAADFASRQELRQGEIDALSKAIEIISSQTVEGSGEKHLPQLLQVSSAFSQLRSNQNSPLQAQIAAFLAEKARNTGSRVLAQASQQIAASPFDRVLKMIQDLISKLTQEATSEMEHKGWCDTELGTNKLTRESKTASVADLTAHIEDLTATIAQLTQDISDLTKGIAELEEQLATAAKNRADSHATNEQTIKEAKEAQVAVEQALAILKDFYAKSAQATALSQQTPGEDAPETFDKPYQGMLPEGGSIVDFLEVILTDFARLESQTSADEAAQQEEYEKLKFEGEKDKALKINEKGHKEDQKDKAEGDLAIAEEERKSEQEALDKANAYYEKLKPTCVDSGITYEERVKRREEEIQSLTEALQILKGESI